MHTSRLSYYCLILSKKIKVQTLTSDDLIDGYLMMHRDNLFYQSINESDCICTVLLILDAAFHI